MREEDCMTTQAARQSDGTARIELTKVWVAWLPIVIAIGGIVYSAAVTSASRPEREEVKVMVREANEQSKETLNTKMQSVERRIDEIGDIVKETRDEIRELRKQRGRQ